MNVKRKKTVNATNATAKTHGEVKSALVAAACCIVGTIIPALVSLTAKIHFTIYLCGFCF